MDEDFLDVTQSGNKTVAFVLISITLFILVFGYFFVYQKFHFAVKTVSVEVGSTLSVDVNDYLKKTVVDTSGYKLDVSKVKIDEVGEYDYTVTYNNKTKKGKVKVVDTTPPTFVTQEYTVEVGDEDVFLGNFLESCEDVSKPWLVTFKNSEDDEKLNTVGTYNVTIVVSDIYNNKTETNVVLNVVEEGSIKDERTLDLEYASAEFELEDFTNQYYEKLEEAIVKDGEEAERLATQLSSIDLEKYVQENYEGYTLKESKLIEIYNKSDYIIGYVITITIDNGSTKTVYVTK